MTKKIMIPIMGLALIGFAGCSDVAAPAYNPPANPATTQFVNDSTVFKNQGEMVNYCKGMISEKAGTKPMYVKMTGVLVVEQGVKPASKASGTAHGKKYTCEFDTEGKYFDVHVAY